MSIARSIRLVVTGPECTGKTTLARELGAALGAPVVLEAARLFAERHDEPLSLATVPLIAELAIELDDAAMAQGRPPVLVRDTDLVSTVVYSRHYYGTLARWVAAEAAARLGDLYLLCAPDLPWEPDGIRDRPAEREELYADFAAELARLGARVAVVRGLGAARTAAALAAVRASGLIAARGASS